MRFDAATLAAYEAHARTYADDWLGQPPPTDLQDAVRRYFKSGAAGGISADIGCGSGRDVDWLERNGYPCVGFDGSDALLTEAQRRFGDRRFEKSVLPLLPEIAPRTFDNVLCETVVMHLPLDAIAPAIDGLRRILVHDGVLYLSWRVGDVDARDERGRLYTAFDASLVREALAGMTILHDAEATSASSGKRIHAVVARANGHGFNRRPRRTEARHNSTHTPPVERLDQGGRRGIVGKLDSRRAAKAALPCSFNRLREWHRSCGHPFRLATGRDQVPSEPINSTRMAAMTLGYRFKQRAVGAAMMLSLAAFAPIANAGLVGVSFLSSALYDVNTVTGATSNARTIGINGLDGVAFRPSDNALFGLSQAGSTPAPNAFYRINVATGIPTLIGLTGLSGIVEGDLAFDPTTGLLYGIQDTVSFSRALFSINVATGVATTIGNVNGGNGDLSSLAFDAAGNLFTIDTSGSRLLQVNKSTGATISSVSTSTVLGSVAGMAFDPTSGIAYVADGNGGSTGSFNLYTLNTSTGALTSIGSTAVAGGLSGLSFTFAPSAVPEPSSIALFGLGLMGVALAARRRRKGA